jgi:hypothetical protein
MKIRALLALALVCVASAAAASSVTDFVKAADHLKLGEAKPVDNVSFSIGHLKLKLASGSAAPVASPWAFSSAGKAPLTTRRQTLRSYRWLPTMSAQSRTSK